MGQERLEAMVYIHTRNGGEVIRIGKQVHKPVQVGCTLKPERIRQESRAFPAMSASCSLHTCAGVGDLTIACMGKLHR